jgi:DNA-binding transcriptional LysR family regulator
MHGRIKSMTAEYGQDRPFAGLTLERLESFIAVADAGGIARAAPDNPTRQSQLSRQLREIQRALGFEITRRDGQRVVLTPRGAQLRAMLREFYATLTALRSEHAAQPVSVTLAAGDSVLRWVVLPRLHEVLAHSPGVDLSVRAVTKGFAAVRDGTYDLAICRSRRKPDGMKLTRIGVLRYALFAPRINGKRRGARSIATLPFVHVTGAQDLMEKLYETLDVAPSVALRCETFPQAALAVASGHYASLLPITAAREINRTIATPIEGIDLSALDLPLALAARERRLDTVAALDALYASLAKHLARVLDA